MFSVYNINNHSVALFGDECLSCVKIDGHYEFTPNLIFTDKNYICPISFTNLTRSIDKTKPDFIVNAYVFNLLRQSIDGVSDKLVYFVRLSKFLAAQANLFNIPILHITSKFQPDFPISPFSIYRYIGSRSDSNLYLSFFQAECNVRAMTPQHFIFRNHFFLDDKKINTNCSGFKILPNFDIQFLT